TAAASSNCRARPRAMPSAATSWTRCWPWPKPASASCWSCSARRWPAEVAPMKLVLASSNRGKLDELRHLLAGSGIELVAQSDLGVEDAEETGLTFIENALIKARHASRVTGLPALADDSGLCVDALGGAPGLYSARYAGEPADPQRNIDKLLTELEGVDD